MMEEFCLLHMQYFLFHRAIPNKTNQEEQIVIVVARLEFSNIPIIIILVMFFLHILHGEYLLVILLISALKYLVL